MLTTNEKNHAQSIVNDKTQNAKIRERAERILAAQSENAKRDKDERISVNARKEVCDALLAELAEAKKSKNLSRAKAIRAKLRKNAYYISVNRASVNK